MAEVEIIEKPDSISWDEIHEILLKAHADNRSKGIYMRTADLSGEELRERLGDDGICYVAIVDGQLAGTASIKFCERRRWYVNGTIGDFMLTGVVPGFGGHGIYSALCQAREDAARARGVAVLEMDTNENNLPVQKILAKRGFRHVSMFVSPYVRHYSVVMAKWLGECPYSDAYCRRRFLWESFKIKLRYKPGRIKRLF